jgi:hypothetical protein
MPVKLEGTNRTQAGLLAVEAGLTGEASRDGRYRGSRRVGA